MILPTYQALTIAVLVLSMLCLGSWGNAFKSSRWRFELFYIDFALGAVLAAVVAAFTLGSMGTDISVQDNFLLSGKKEIVFAFLAGCLVNLANMLLVAAIDLSGMAVALPIGLGLGLVVTSIWTFAARQTGSALFLFSGCLVIVGAVVVIALSQGGMDAVRKRIAAANAPPAPLPDPAAPKRKKVVEDRGPGAYRGVWLALAGGLLLGNFAPLAGLSSEGDLGLSNPYAVALVVSMGIFASTFIYNLYFMNLPVRGLPVSPFTYFTGKLAQHGLGLLGGTIWMTGTVASLAGAAAQGDAKVNPGILLAIVNAAILLNILWGIFLWNEYDGADGGLRRLPFLSMLLFAVGIGLAAYGASIQ